MVKIRNINEQRKNEEEFLQEMADKPFGVDERQERISMSLDGWLFDKIDDIVRQRKRLKQNNRTMSAYIREAIFAYMGIKE